LKQRKINKSMVSREVKRYVSSNPKLKGIMSLYRDLFSAQRKLSRRIPDQLPHIKGAQVSYRMEEGRALIEPHELEVDVGVLMEMIRELGGIMGARSEGEKESILLFLEKELDDEERLRSLVDAFLERDEGEISRLMEGYSLDPALLYMLLHVSLAPFFWKKAGALARQADLDQVPRGTCPVCGDLPVMGFLRAEDGLRVLECSLCGSRWGVPRMMCPCCGNSDQGKLSYIFAEGDKSRRVYLCDKCKRYLKVTNLEEGGPEELVIPLEDLATAHLDQAAEERGYSRGCRTVFS
jgi:FdhE protein